MRQIPLITYHSAAGRIWPTLVMCCQCWHNRKQPALTRVQRPKPAMYLIVTHDLDLLSEFSGLIVKHFYVEHLYRCIGFFRYLAGKQADTQTNGDDKPHPCDFRIGVGNNLILIIVCLKHQVWTGFYRLTICDCFPRYIYASIFMLFGCHRYQRT